MTIKQLIEKLKEYPEDMPITIDSCMDFSEAYGNTIAVKIKEYSCYPFTENDKFNYISLEIKDKEYWSERNW